MFTALCRFVLCATLCMCACADDIEHPTGDLTLADALALALRQNPALQVYSWEIRAAEARTLQAGLRPNPELSLEIEEVRWTSGPGTETVSRTVNGAIEGRSVTVPGGNGQGVAIPVLDLKPTLGQTRTVEQGARSGFSESEVTLSLSQLIELGGKRAKRIRLAEREQELAQWDYEAARANVIESVAGAFVNVLAAQEQLDLLDELTALAGQVLDTVSKQVQAGAVSPLEENRARVTMDSTRIERERAVGELAAARTALAATWGERRAAFGRAVGRLDEIPELTPLEALESSIGGNPDLARWATEMARRDAAYVLARAQRVPNPTVSFGFRSTGIGSRSSTTYGIDTDGAFGFDHSNADGESDRDNSLVLGFSIPLPLFDRNQGNIQEAEYLTHKTSEERRAAENDAYAALGETYQRLSATRSEIGVLRDNILPTATETFEKTQEGYRQGKFGYLDVLDAEHTLFGARRQALDAMATYHTLRVRLERLTGQGLNELPEVREALEVDSHE